MLPPVTSYELEVRETALGEIAFAEIAGELDLTNAEELARRLDELAADADCVVLDLDRLQFLDSAALHVLFILARRLEGEGKRLGVVLDSASPVAKTISIVSFEEVATVRSSLDDVLAEFSG
jgi:anti-anti-sigma factor